MSPAAMEALARAQDGLARITAGEQAWETAVAAEMASHRGLHRGAAEIRVRDSRAGLVAVQEMTVGGSIARTQAAVASALLLADVVQLLAQLRDELLFGVATERSTR